MTWNLNLSLTMYLLVLLPVSVSAGPSGGGYEVFNSTIDGGGGKSDGGDYELTGTIGQYDADNASKGGSYQLNGGFWGGGIAGNLMFKDSFESVASKPVSKSRITTPSKK